MFHYLVYVSKLERMENIHNKAWNSIEKTQSTPAFFYYCCETVNEKKTGIFIFGI